MRYLRVVSIAALLAVALTCEVLADLQIAFYSDREGELPLVERSVFSMNPDGSNLVNLSKEIGLDSLPSVSPDKTTYLFSSKRTGDSEIFVMNVDGSNLVNLTNAPEIDQGPRWSPDGTQILWNRGSTRWRHGAADIFTMNADGSDKRNLGNGNWPRWSPDGRMIGFTLGRVDQQNAFVMNADGSGRRRVTDELFPTRFLSWSRDGTKVAFDHRKHFGFVQNKIYIVNLDGTGFFELTKDVPEIDCYGAAWSPDGTKIAITSTGGIYVLNSDGTNPVNITIHHDFRWGRNPRWSPDGTKILYEFEVQIGDVHHGEIYVMNADGSNPINLTNHPAHDWAAKWQVYPSSTLVSPQEKLISTWGQIKAVVSGQ